MLASESKGRDIKWLHCLSYIVSREKRIMYEVYLTRVYSKVPFWVALEACTMLGSLLTSQTCDTPINMTVSRLFHFRSYVNLAAKAAAARCCGEPRLVPGFTFTFSQR